MLLVVTVLEHSGTLGACELKLFQHVQHKYIWLARRRVINPAVGTGLLLQDPVVHASLAIQPVALAALDHLRRDHVKANGAREKLVYRLHSLLRRQYQVL